MNKMTRLSVLITCHNRRAKTLACLERLFANTLPESTTMHVFLVDDGSDDDTETAVRERFPLVEIIRGDGSLYWNRGMHRAFSRAMEIGFDAYLWLNDDTVLYPAAIGSLIRCWKEISDKGRVGIVVGSTQDPTTEILTYGGVAKKSAIRPLHYILVEPQYAAIECDAMNGNCVLVPRDVVDVVGNLDRKFMHAMGDIDYGLRARKAGFKIWVAPGYVGTCARNSTEDTFKDRSLTLRKRWMRIVQPKGLPPSSWLVFTRRHGGPFWPAYFVWPYLSMMLSN